MCHDIHRSEDELATLAGSTAAEGTTAPGMLKALRAVQGEHPELIVAPIRESRRDVALAQLRLALLDGHVVILCVDHYEHWVVAFGLLGRHCVHVSDSADTEMVNHMSWPALAERWRGPDGVRYPYYGVIV